MASTVIELSQPESAVVVVDGQPTQFTVTHINACKSEWEEARGDKLGWVVVWIEKGTIIDNRFVATPNYPGEQLLIDGDIYDALIQCECDWKVCDVPWKCIENLLVQTGIIQGTVVEYDIA